MQYQWSVGRTGIRCFAPVRPMNGSASEVPSATDPGRCGSPASHVLRSVGLNRQTRPHGPTVPAGGKHAVEAPGFYQRWVGAVTRHKVIAVLVTFVALVFFMTFWAFFSSWVISLFRR